MSTIAGYQLGERLYESATTLIYRAHASLDQQPVVLKLLKDPYPAPERIARFQREYELTRSLHQHIDTVVAAYQLHTDQSRWLMVLEDFGGESLKRLGLAGGLTVAEFLALAIAITDTVGHVHRHG